MSSAWMPFGLGSGDRSGGSGLGSPRRSSEGSLRASRPARRRPPFSAPTAWQATRGHPACRFRAALAQVPMSSASPSCDPASVARPASAPGNDDGVFAGFAASGTIAGGAEAVAGLVWGGIGGRIAMRVVFLSSNDGVRGLTSDDGFEIGTISSATMFLLVSPPSSVESQGSAWGSSAWSHPAPSGPWQSACSLCRRCVRWSGDRAHRRRRLPPARPPLVDNRAVRLDPRVVGCDRCRRHGATLAHQHRRPSTPCPPRYWGASGWMLLVVITTIGVQGLVTDVATLT